MNKSLILTILIGVSAVIGTVIVGSMLFEGTVVKDPYATALHWDASQHARMQSGLNVAVVSKSFTTPTSEMIISVRDRAGKSLTDAVIDLHLTMPATDRYDSEYRMEHIMPGIYRCAVKVPVRGRWLVRLNIKKDGKSVMFDDTFYVE